MRNALDQADVAPHRGPGSEASKFLSKKPSAASFVMSNRRVCDTRRIEEMDKKEVRDVAEVKQI
jgi:hypothetical protein